MVSPAGVATLHAKSSWFRKEFRMRTLPFVVLAVVCLPAWACSSTSAGGGSTEVDAVAGSDAAIDAATGADALADTSSGGDAGGTDATLADSTADGSDAQPGDDAGQKDSQVTDAALMDSAADGGGKDADSPDVWTPDVQPDSSTADIDTSPCAKACQHILDAGCPNEDTMAKCMAGCVEFASTAIAAKCEADYLAFLQCAQTATLTCKNGKADPSACDAPMQVVQTCMAGSTPTGCVNPSCSGGVGPGGVQSCSCAATCSGADVSITCNGTSCSCFAYGAKVKDFPQGATCTGDVMQTLSTVCLGP